MTFKKYHDGQILEREDYERKTYYEIEEDGETRQIPEEEIEFRSVCDLCGELKQPFETVRVGMAGSPTTVCREHVSDEIREVAELE